MPEELLVPDRFPQWLLRSKKSLSWPSISIAVPIIAAVVSQIPSVLAWPGLTTVLLALQLVIILVLLFLIPEPLEDPRQSPRASIAVKQFHTGWRLVWLFWLFEFVGLTAQEFAEIAIVRPNATGALFLTSPWTSAVGTTLLNLLNNLPTVALYICYKVASEKTVYERDGHVSARALPWDRAFGVLFVVTVAELALRANSIEHWIPLMPDITKAFTWGSGLAAGLVTALIVGRLDSKFISLPPLVITLLYLYAVIQPAWATFNDIPVRAVVLNMALALKCLLFVLVVWLLRSGVFLFFFERVGKLYDSVAPERQRFLARVQRSMDAIPKDTSEIGHASEPP